MRKHTRQGIKNKAKQNKQTNKQASKQTNKQKHVRDFNTDVSKNSFLYAAVNGHLELPLLKDRQNLEVYKFRDWRILTYFIFGHGESSPYNI